MIKNYTMKKTVKTCLLLSCIALSTAKIKAQELPQLGKAPIKEVIAAMTLEEKVALVVGTGLKFDAATTKNAVFKIPNQPIPGSLADKSKVYVNGAVGRTLEIPRLGVTTIEMVDGPAGVSFGSTTTAYPIATALATTWDEKLVYEVGRCMGTEAAEYGLDVLLTPAINIQRNPLTGRNFEYYSEDPLLSGKMGGAMIKGIQSKGVGASLKHFAANNQETNRIEVDAVVSQRALREIYLKGFEIAINEAKPYTLMASYNSINGTLATQNYDLLTKVARKDWKYDGVIMSDWEAGVDPVAQMKAGLNLIMPGPYKDTILLKAVKEGKLDEKVLDSNIEWILKAAMRMPKFNKYAYSKTIDFNSHTEVARNAAAQGMVLLKNEFNTLPFNETKSKIALFGNGAYETIISGSGSGFVMRAGPTVHIIDGIVSKGFSVSNELKEVYQKYIAENTPKTNMIDLTRGRKNRAPEMQLDKNLVDAIAEQADYAVLTISRISGETADRKIEGDFELTELERNNLNNLTKAFHNKGKKVVVILNIGAPIETASWKAIPDAILIAWQPGQVAGNAVADVISGQTNPSGKLTACFPVKYSDVSSAKNFPGFPVEKPKQVVYEEGIYVGYRYYNTFNVPTSYPFGFGLSYTTFKYDNLKVSTKRFKNKIKVTATITNTGSVAGREVVQLYIAAPKTRIDKPSIELKGFVKTSLLQPGQSEKVTFDLDSKDLASFDAEQSAWILDQGTYQVQVAASSLDSKLSETFKVARMVKIETVQNALEPKSIINELKPNR